jgi:vacuolar-type H+-ATPase subunit E/Vma4
MASPALFETMTRQVEAECAEHLAKAKAEADRIVADAHTKARAAAEASLASAKAERDRLDSLWRQKADAEAVRLELAMKNDAVEAVLAEVSVGIKKLVDGPEFQTTLESLLSELMAAVAGEKDVRVLGPVSKVDFIRTWLSSHGHSGVAVEGSPEFWDGVAVQDPARTWRVSNTLTTRFAHVDQAVRKHCMTALFGAGGAA